MCSIYTNGSRGENSFAANPPRTVLSAANLKPLKLAITAVKLSGNKVIYELRTNSPESKQALTNDKLKQPVLKIEQKEPPLAEVPLDKVID
jgi:hypothetical protein